LPINVDMVVLRNHINAANWHFTLATSELRHLIAHLGGFAPAGTAIGALAALRMGLPEDPIVDHIMGNPTTGVAAIPLVKRQKYAAALTYLLTLMGIPNAARLVVKDHREIKNNWALVMHNTAGNEQLVHASRVAPAAVHAAGGFDAQFASEFCSRSPMFAGAAPIWNTHEYTFFFERRRVGGPGTAFAALRPPPAAAFFGFGVGGYLYLFRPPGPAPGIALPGAGVMQYRSQNGVVAGQECAFPGLVPLAHLIPYRWDGVNAIQVTWAGADVPVAARIAI
jgi:hypothetical protein